DDHTRPTQWPRDGERPGPWQQEVGLPMQTKATPRRVRVERGIYRTPAGTLEIQYTDSDGRVRWKRVPGGLRDARYARAEIQARLGRGERVAPSRRPFAEIAEEWLAQQRHLRVRTK